MTQSPKHLHVIADIEVDFWIFVVVINIVASYFRSLFMIFATLNSKGSRACLLRISMLYVIQKEGPWVRACKMYTSTLGLVLLDFDYTTALVYCSPCIFLKCTLVLLYFGLCYCSCYIWDMSSWCVLAMALNIQVEVKTVMPLDVIALLGDLLVYCLA